jgi:hypothetical protein
MSIQHVLPINDLYEHSEDDCLCGPDIEPVRREDGSVVGWLITHHSLDGREAHDEDKKA